MKNKENGQELFEIFYPKGNWKTYPFKKRFEDNEKAYLDVVFKKMREQLEATKEFELECAKQHSSD